MLIRWKNSFTLVKLAAAVLILIVTGALYSRFSTTFPSSTQANLPTIEIINIVTKTGEKSILILSDATKIILNSSSRLIFPDRFSAEPRKVALIGEAFFEVARDEDRPFSIVTGELVTTVLGSSFNISTYPNADQIKIAVVTGKVSVLDTIANLAPDAITLLPNEVTVFHKYPSTFEKTTFDSLGEWGWKEGIINFKDGGIDTIIATLSQWYGVTFNINKRIEKTTDYSGI